MNHNFLIHSSADGYLGCFHVLKIVVIKSLSLVRLFCDSMHCSPSPLSMGFPRQKYWSKLPFPPPGDFPDPGIESRSLALQVDSLPLNHQGSPKKAQPYQNKISIIHASLKN